MGKGVSKWQWHLQFVLASATAMLVPFLASLANPPTRSAKATICAFAKRVVHSGAISSLFCKMSPTRCGQFDMSFGSENTRSKSPPFSKPRFYRPTKKYWGFFWMLAILTVADFEFLQLLALCASTECSDLLAKSPPV